MARIDNLDGGELARLKARISALENASPLANSSVERGQLRMYSGSSLLIQDGNLTVSGTGTVTGTFNVTGTLGVTGPSNLSGPVSITGATTIAGPTDITGAATISGTANISGATTIDGAVTLNNDLTLGTGKIVAGIVTIDKLGGTGGRVASTGDLLLVGGSGNSVTVSPRLVVFGDENVNGDQTVYGNQTVTGVKSFRMDHPTKPGWWIQHGSTESPISGTEYTGTGSFDAVGKSIIELPDYFEALNKPENRTVHLTAIGRPFMVGADRVVGGKFTVYGQAGREFDWLVKAERFGGDFEAESKKSESV